MKRLLLVLAILMPSMASAQGLLPYVEGTFFANDGSPLSSGFVCTTISGTTTNLATYPTYADAVAGTNANANPVHLDSSGRANIWLGTGVYRIVILNATGQGSSTCNGTPTGSAIKTVDGVGGFPQPLILENINNIRYCNAFPGSTAGAKIAACIADLPSTGGTADARGIQGSQSVVQDVWSGNTKPVTLLLGAATFAANTTQGIQCACSMLGYGTTWNYSGVGTALTVTGSIAINVDIEGVKFQGSSAAVGGAINISATQILTTVRRNYFTGFTNAGASDITISTNNGDISNNVFFGGNRGIKLTGTGQAVQVANNSFTTYAIEDVYVQATGNTFFRNSFNGATTPIGIHLDGGSNHTIFSNWFEGQSSEMILLENSTTDNTIRENHFDGLSVTPYAIVQTSGARNSFGRNYPINLTTGVSNITFTTADNSCLLCDAGVSNLPADQRPFGLVLTTADRAESGATLQTTMNTTTAYITSSSASGYPVTSQFYITIGSEIMFVDFVNQGTNTSWHVRRAQLGTTAASHSIGATITRAPTAPVIENSQANVAPDTKRLNNDFGLVNPIVIDTDWLGLADVATYSTDDMGTTWTVEAGDITTLQRVQLGRTLIISFTIQNSSLSSNMATALQISGLLPSGFTAAHLMACAAHIVDNGTHTGGWCRIGVADNVVKILKNDDSAFATSTNQTDVYGELTIEIQ